MERLGPAQIEVQQVAHGFLPAAWTHDGICFKIANVVGEFTPDTRVVHVRAFAPDQRYIGFFCLEYIDGLWISTPE